MISGRLLERKMRLDFMESMASVETKHSLERGFEGWVEIKRFLAMFEINTGVRPQISKTYFDTFVNYGTFEVKDGKFRAKGVTHES